MNEYDVGEDVEVGAAPRFTGRKYLSAAAARRIVRASPAAGAQGVGVALGLGSTTITTGTSATLDATVQEPVALDRLSISVSYSSNWDGGLVTVTDVKIGTRSLLAGTEALPAAVFAPGSDDPARCLGRGLVVGPGKTITLELGVSSAATLGSAKIVAGFSGWAR